jgi:vacuolar protein sorting-associated protein 35
MAPIVKDVQDTPARKEDIYTMDVAEEFEDEQNLVCRTIHIVECDDVQTLIKMYSGIRKQLGQGGPDRLKYTLKAMSLLYMRLALRIKKLEQSGAELQITCEKPFQYIHSGDQKGILEILVQQTPLQAFHIYIACANAADVCELHDLCYDLYTEAFTIYEENAADTKDQVLMLNVMTSSLCALRNIADESAYEVLATKVCQYSSKLLKKHDQSRMAATCSHLFWKKALSAPLHKKVLECMQRSLKLADQSQAQHQLPLFVELLNQFLHYYAAQTPGVTVTFIAALVDLIRQASAAGEEGGDRTAHDAARTYYRNTAKYIRSRQKDDERWQEIEV